ncbi:MAG: outer membrane beta-barrel protein, partial [Gammaproteobacteria bacterium]|nr:outer membrane beta-barrel protein [Gammaproteobacteria bacterium]
GFYAGFGVGPTNFGERFPVLKLTSERHAEINQDSTGWAVYGGYRFLKYLSAEIEYSQLGTFRGVIKDSAGNTIDNYWIKLSARNASIRGELPVWDKFYVCARFGLGSVTIDDGPTPYLQGKSINILFGLPGVEYRATDNVFVRLELALNMFGTDYETTNSVAGTLVTYKAVQDVQIEQLMLSVGYAF